MFWIIKYNESNYGFAGQSMSCAEIFAMSFWEPESHSGATPLDSFCHCILVLLGAGRSLHFGSFSGRSVAIVIPLHLWQWVILLPALGKKKWSVPTNRSIMNLVLHMDDSMHDSFGNSCQEALCSCCAMAKKRKVGTSYIADIDEWCNKWIVYYAF